MNIRSYRGLVVTSSLLQPGSKKPFMLEQHDEATLWLSAANN